MNIKTPIFLLIALLLVAGYLFFTREKEQSAQPQIHKLVDVDAAEVNAVTIAPAEGKKIVLKKTGADWHMTEPVDSPADNDQVTSLIDSLVNMKSTAEDTSVPADASGLQKPQYTVELSGPQSVSIAFGNKLAVSDGVYAQVQGKAVDVVPAEVLTKLDQAASSYRQTRLVMTPSLNITQVVINEKPQPLVLQKRGDDWEITSPQKMAADTPAVTDLLTSLTGLKAATFVDDPTEAADAMKGSPPITSITFMATPNPEPGAATTKPSTQPVATTIKFGAYDDILKKHIYTQVEGSPFIAKVDTSSVTALEKKPLDLRDKKVLDIDPDQVSNFSIITTLVKEPNAKGAAVIVERRQGGASKGVPFVNTAAANATATSAATQPSLADKIQLPNAKPPSPWVLANGDDADENDVKDFLTALHPLRVDKYLETNPVTQPATQFVVKILTQAAGGAGSADHELRLIDRGNDQPYVGIYNGLTFEISRFTLSKFLQGDFKPHAANPSSPAGVQ